jgi:DNA invertase Pin-like site-specific DNA recombinase
MIGVYIRISSYSQKADSQRAEIEKWLTSHGHNLADVLWFEDTETGKTLDRPAAGLLFSSKIVAGGGGPCYNHCIT